MIGHPGADAGQPTAPLTAAGDGLSTEPMRASIAAGGGVGGETLEMVGVWGIFYDSLEILL
jgi:hypothetical protein